MIVLPRAVGESIVIDDQITVTVLAIEGDDVVLEIDAPPGVEILGQHEPLAATLSD